MIHTEGYGYAPANDDQVDRFRGYGSGQATPGRSSRSNEGEGDRAPACGMRDASGFGCGVGTGWGSIGGTTCS